MPKRLMQDLVESLGYCCVREFIKNSKVKGTRPQAKMLGVDRQVIQYWKRKIKEGESTCTESDKCIKLLVRAAKRESWG